MTRGKSMGESSGRTNKKPRPEPLLIAPDTRVDLSAFNPGSTAALKDKDGAEEELRRNTARIAELQYALWAERRRALLVLLQGLDTSGKDGVIRHVFSGLNPLGIRVHSFGRPTPVELAHDFLWRVHAVIPARGELSVFNRSHYEDVLVVRVEKLAPPDAVERRYAIINDFERLLSAEGGGYVTILKFFLHISLEEQRERLRARLTDLTKSWKVQPEDLVTHARWDDYQAAYEIALSRCSTAWAPWRVIPADKKWARNTLVSRVVLRTLEEMDPRFPPPRSDATLLLEQLGRGA